MNTNGHRLETGAESSGATQHVEHFSLKILYYYLEKFLFF